jgi:Lon protease-like protein
MLSYSEDAEEFRSIPRLIPVFPLPNVVFFPKTYLPLHIFEPRYSQMIADAAAEGHGVGIVLLKEGWERNYHGNPAIFGVGCVGRLVSIQRLTDGRYNVVLYGFGRCEIREQFYEKQYRQAKVVLTPCVKDMSIDRKLRGDLIGLLDDYLHASDHGSVCRWALESEVQDEVLVNSLGTYLDFSPLEKQLLLEAESLNQRACRLRDLLHFKLYDRRGVKGSG